jgi:hypothetical protein
MTFVDEPSGAKTNVHTTDHEDIDETTEKINHGDKKTLTWKICISCLNTYAYAKDICPMNTMRLRTIYKILNVYPNSQPVPDFAFNAV